MAVSVPESYSFICITCRIAMGTGRIMKRALRALAAGVALACISDAASAHGSVGIYLGAPVYVSPPPIIYRPYPPPVAYQPYPPVIYQGPPVLYRPGPLIYGPPPGYYSGYRYGYGRGWGRPYWRGYGYGHGGYRSWHHRKYHR
jgi:hypothetical protein